MRFEKKLMHFNRSALKRRLDEWLLAAMPSFSQDCVPKLKFCVASIEAFDRRLGQQDTRALCWKLCVPLLECAFNSRAG